MHLGSRQAHEKVLRNLVQDFVFTYYVHAVARRPLKQKAFSLGRNLYCFGCNSNGILQSKKKLIKIIIVRLTICCRTLGWILEFFEDPFFFL